MTHAKDNKDDSAPDADVEITRTMVKAGVGALSQARFCDVSDMDAVTEIYTRMVASRDLDRGD